MATGMGLQGKDVESIWMSANYYQLLMHQGLCDASLTVNARLVLVLVQCSFKTVHLTSPQGL